MKKLLQKFSASKAGVAAVEFALVLPFMLVLFFGTNEVTTGLMISRKVENVVRITTDLTGMYPHLKQQDIHEIFKASEHVIAPYSKEPLGLSMTGVEVNDNGEAKVLWNFTQNSAKGYVCGQKIAVPDIYLPKKGETAFLILGGADYAYKPSTSYMITGTINLHNEKYWLSRSNGNITVENGGCG